MHAHRMGMVPVSAPPTTHRPIHALPGMRNRQRSTSPTNASNVLPAMKLRPNEPNAAHVSPPLNRLSSFSSVASASGVEDRLSARPRELSSASESERTHLPSLSSITSRKRAYTNESEPAAKTSGPVYYQSRDKQRLPSPTTHHRSMRDSRLLSPTAAEGDGVQKRARTERSPSDHKGYRNGLELLLNALESPDNAGL
jgi:hypothetical protein